jgi:hypothetical protein
MRAADKTIFSDAARQFRAWILVRRTNPDSLKYVGQAGYVPKRIDCKPKTADTDHGRPIWAGLVVCPPLCSGAFLSDKKKSDAASSWAKFVAQEGLGKPNCQSPYSVDENKQSKHYGCLMFEGSYIHGDYDLYDIILVDHPSANLAAVETLHGQPHLRGPRVIPIMQYINERIGAPMVQHGGEAQYADHSQQAIDAFGPDGEVCTILNEFSVRAWYRDRFGGRQTLAKH